MKPPFGSWVSNNTLRHVHVMKHLCFIPLDDVPDDNVRMHAELMVQLFIAMTARVMQDTVDKTTIADTDRHVGSFLTVTCELQRAANKDGKQKNSKWKLHLICRDH